jgi:methyl-accepting chemotaxis protein
VALFSSILDRLLSPIIAAIEAFLSPILKPLKQLADTFTQVFTKVPETVGKAQDTVNEIFDIYDEIKNFTLQPAWRNRVVSVPRAIENIKRLAAVPQEILNVVKDLIKQVKESFGKFDERELAQDIEGIGEADIAESSEAISKFFGKLGPKLAKIFEKILGVAAVILQVLQNVEQTIDDIKTVVDDLKEVLDDLNHLDGIFLPQNNPRRILQLEDGGSIKIRVGNLHS